MTDGNPQLENGYTRIANELQVALAKAMAQGIITGKERAVVDWMLEHELVLKLNEMGFKAERVPLSGGAGGSFTGDLIINGKKAEVKGRAAGFKEIYKWLEPVDFLFIRADRQEWLVVMRVKDFKG